MTSRVLRSLASGIFFSSVALALGACDDQRDNDGYATSATAYCAQYRSCGACTPVVGCGWCFNGDGSGVCAPDPDYCSGKQFSWTWEPNGCHVAADAGAGVGDAARDAPASDAPADAAADAADAATD